MLTIRRFVTIAILFISLQAAGQPFLNEINAFRKQDSISTPPKNAILFVGSSSFRMWHDVQNYFPGYTIINRGFGGSSLPDVIRYADDIILPYQPRQVVVYCGENDIAADDTLSAAVVTERFKTLFNIIRNKYRKVPIVFVSIKPSPSRWTMQDRMVETNRLVREFLATKKKTSYVDVYTPMLKPDGKPMEDLFLKDNLHMTPKGYVIWQKAIEPILLKEKNTRK